MFNMLSFTCGPCSYASCHPVLVFYHTNQNKYWLSFSFICPVAILPMLPGETTHEKKLTLEFHHLLLLKGGVQMQRVSYISMRRYFRLCWQSKWAGCSTTTARCVKGDTIPVVSSQVTVTLPRCVHNRHVAVKLYSCHWHKELQDTRMENKWDP